MDFGKLKEFSDRVGAAYGSEDLALFLYALIKMQKPQCILELGTGDGAATVWMAQALKENNRMPHNPSAIRTRPSIIIGTLCSMTKHAVPKQQMQGIQQQARRKR